MSTSGSRQAQLRKLMRERAGGLKAGGVSIKEKYKALRKLKAVERAKKKQMSSGMMPPPKPRAAVAADKPARPAPTPADTQGLPTGFFDKPSAVKTAAPTPQPSKPTAKEATGAPKTAVPPAAASRQIPAGFFDNPGAALRAAGVSRDFSSELQSLTSQINDDQEARKRDERDIEAKLKNFRDEEESADAEFYADAVSRMRKRAEAFKKRMLEKRRKREAKADLGGAQTQFAKSLHK